MFHFTNFDKFPLCFRFLLDPKFVKFVLLQESEYLDGRQHCLTIQTGNGEHHYWSLESRQELLAFEKSWYRANFLAVKHLGVRTEIFSSEKSFILGFWLPWYAGFNSF